MDLKSTFPALYNKSLSLMNEMLPDVVTKAGEIFEGPEVLKGFNPDEDVWRGVTMLKRLKHERWSPGQSGPEAKTVQDYELIMLKRGFRVDYKFEKPLAKLGQQRAYDFISEHMAEALRDKAEIIDEFAFNFFNFGTIANGHAFFDNSLLTTSNAVADAYPLKVYDNIALFSASHRTSKADATAVGNYQDTTFAFTYPNFQTAYTQYTVTMALDRLGRQVEQYPDIVLCNPASKFTVEPILKSAYTSGDMQTNAAQDLVQPFYSRRLVGTPTNTTTAQWALTKKKNTGICIVPQWGADEIDLWRDDDTKLEYMSHIFYFGGVVYEVRRTLMCNQTTT